MSPGNNDKVDYTEIFHAPSRPQLEKQGKEIPSCAC